MPMAFWLIICYTTGKRITVMIHLCDTNNDWFINHYKRITRIELVLSAWKAEVLPLNYIRTIDRLQFRAYLR